jgi:subtilisin family serine protease
VKNGAGFSSRDLDIPNEFLAGLESCGARVVCGSRWLQAVSVEIAAADLHRLSELPDVVSTKPVMYLKKNDAGEAQWEDIREEASSMRYSSGAYGVSYRQAELANVIELHRRGLTGKGVLIGVIDTGFQLDHRAFAGMDLVAQYDFINHDSDPSLDARTDARGQASHGTACLSVLAGYEPGKLGGIAPSASYVLAKTEDNRSETAVEEDYWIEAIEWMEWLGVEVVSSSLTYRDWYGSDEMDGETAPITRAAERAVELGMVICISAGNAGPKPITIGAPADGPDILAIAAVDSSGRLTGFSSRGPSSDGRIKPDVAAMGRGVVCVSPHSFDRYARWNGTSLACPIAAGVAALVVEAHPDWSSKRVIEAIRRSADRNYMPDFDYGYGLIDGVRAVDYHK